MRSFQEPHLLHKLVQSLYSRTEGEFNHGNFRIKGDTVDIFPSYADYGFRIHFFGDEIEAIEAFDVNTNKIIEKFMRRSLSILQICLLHLQIFYKTPLKISKMI